MTEVKYLRQRREMALHSARMKNLWRHADFLVAPACPFAKLMAHEEHAAKRRSLLQLTAPFSLARLPALTFPWGPASEQFGWQVLTRRGQDRNLIRLCASLSRFLGGADGSEIRSDI